MKLSIFFCGWCCCGLLESINRGDAGLVLLWTVVAALWAWCLKLSEEPTT